MLHRGMSLVFGKRYEKEVLIDFYLTTGFAIKMFDFNSE